MPHKIIITTNHAIVPNPDRKRNHPSQSKKSVSNFFPIHRSTHQVIPTDVAIHSIVMKSNEELPFLIA